MNTKNVDHQEKPIAELSPADVLYLKSILLPFWNGRMVFGYISVYGNTLQAGRYKNIPILTKVVLIVSSDTSYKLITSNEINWLNWFMSYKTGTRHTLRVDRIHRGAAAFVPTKIISLENIMMPPNNKLSIVDSQKMLTGKFRTSSIFEDAVIPEYGMKCDVTIQCNCQSFKWHFIMPWNNWESFETIICYCHYHIGLKCHD